MRRAAAALLPAPPSHRRSAGSTPRRRRRPQQSEGRIHRVTSVGRSAGKTKRSMQHRIVSRAASAAAQRYPPKVGHSWRTVGMRANAALVSAALPQALLLTTGSTQCAAVAASLTRTRRRGALARVLRSSRGSDPAALCGWRRTRRRRAWQGRERAASERNTALARQAPPASHAQSRKGESTEGARYGEATSRRGGVGADI
jgi:hypothetical protein